MSHDEFKELLVIIESNYSSFNLTEYQMKYWWNLLKDYEFEDIKKKLNYHLEGEYGDRIPKPYWLIKNCMTATQKANQDKKYMICPFCKKKYEYPVEKEMWDRCYERCSSLEYINRMSKRLGIDKMKIFGTRVEKLKLSEINQVYYQFLEEVLTFENRLSEDEIYAIKNTLALTPCSKLKPVELFK